MCVCTYIYIYIYVCIYIYIYIYIYTYLARARDHGAAASCSETSRDQNPWAEKMLGLPSLRFNLIPLRYESARSLSSRIGRVPPTAAQDARDPELAAQARALSGCSVSCCWILPPEWISSLS